MAEKDQKITSLSNEHDGIVEEVYPKTFAHGVIYNGEPLDEFLEYLDETKTNTASGDVSVEQHNQDPNAHKELISGLITLGTQRPDNKPVLWFDTNPLPED